MLNADCPACGAKVMVATKPRLGQLVNCRACKTELEVVWLEPFELDFPFELEDDEDEDDLDDD